MLQGGNKDSYSRLEAEAKMVGFLALLFLPGNDDDDDDEDDDHDEVAAKVSYFERTICTETLLTKCVSFLKGVMVS